MQQRHSKLENVAYQQYTEIYRKHPENPQANLYRGQCAELYWERTLESSFPRSEARSISQNLFQAARTCLAKAVELTPNDASANIEYGYFLWQHSNEMPQGMAYIKHAASLAPTNSRIRAFLGLIYANPSGSAYNLQNAIRELKTSIALDTTYAFPINCFPVCIDRQGKVQMQIENTGHISLMPSRSQTQ